MADPIAVFGAVAGAVQVGDAALRLSRQIYSFLGELRSAREDIRRLRDALRETHDLIRIIVAYIIEWNDSPRVRKEHRNLPPSLTRAVEWFVEDLELLRGCLPENLSCAFVDKVRFVFHKSKIEQVTTRIRERKGTANLALTTIGRHSDLQVLDDLDSMKSSLNDLGSLKTSLDEISNIHRSAAQQQAATLTAVQSTSTTQQQTLARLNQLLDASETNQANMMTEFQSLTTLFTQTVAASPVYSLTANNVSSNPDLLGRILRAELRQLLEPMSQKIDGRLDAIVDSLSRGSSETVHEFSGEEEDLCSTDLPLESGSTDMSTSQDRTQSTEIILSKSCVRSRSKFGALEIRMTRCRARSSGLRAPEAYFRIQVSFCPAPWLSSHGMSAMYSTGPNPFGYYDICPSIIPFSVVSRDSAVVEVITNDDVSCFRQMLDKGDIHWRDQMDGFGYIELALTESAPRICQFLIDIYGPDPGKISAFWILALILSRPSPYARSLRVHEMVQTYRRLDDYIDDLSAWHWELLALTMLESARTWHPVKTPGESSTVVDNISSGRESLWAFPWYEFNLALGIPMCEDLSRELWYLDLYLVRGGDPNQEATLGIVPWLPLEAALILTTSCLPTQHPEEERSLIGVLIKTGGREYVPSLFPIKPRIPGPLLKFYTKVHFPDGMADPKELADAEERQTNWKGFEEQTCIIDAESTSGSDEASARDSEPPATDDVLEDGEEKTDPLILLTPLINAGADVHACFAENERPWGTLTDLALQLGLEEIWATALEKGGYSPAAVKAESRRRYENEKKMRGGCASGVDVSVVEVPDASGLRYRGKETGS